VTVGKRNGTVRGVVARRTVLVWTAKTDMGMQGRRPGPEKTDLTEHLRVEWKTGARMKCGESRARFLPIPITVILILPA
jgi:hypothetical protein